MVAKVIRLSVTFVTEHPSPTDYSQADFHRVSMGDDHGHD